MTTGEASQPGVGAAIARPAIVGMAIIAAFVLVFFGWGALAPLEGGALAPGRISPEGSRRTVQHLEGGIVSQFNVRDGDLVTRGDVLVVMQETQARAGFEVLLNQQRVFQAQRARLRSEQAGDASPGFPDELTTLAASDAEFADYLATQTDLFLRRTELHTNRQAVFRQRALQLEAEISGLRDQIRSQNVRLGLIAEEIEATRTLYERGLAPRPRLLALQREEASITEQRAANRAAIARAEQTIGETEVQLLAADSQRLDEISTELNTVQAELAEVDERLLASTDVLDRTIVRAPISGIVVNLRVRTEGGVLNPGDPVLDIVPVNEALIIDARLSPMDVDVVSPGQRASVHLSALPQKSLPRIDGEVIDVSADALTDEATGESFFRVRVRVDLEELEALGEQIGADLTLYPGMPADVLIVTGERSMLGYLLEPLRGSMRNALREA